MPRQTRSTAKPALTTPELPALYTYTISMYEVEHSGDIENVMDALRKNGLVVVSLITERDFTEYDSETGAVVLTSPQRPNEVSKIVKATSFTDGVSEGNTIDSIEAETRGEWEYENEKYGDRDDLEHDDGR